MNTSKHEQRILRALIENLGAAGYKPAAVHIEDGYYLMPTAADGDIQELESGTEPELIARPMTADEVVDVLYKTYDTFTPTIHFTLKGLTTWGNRGVMVVVSNGKDFISDWHCGDKAFDAIVDQVGTAAYDEVYA